jgi:hypothetical protein
LLAATRRDVPFRMGNGGHEAEAVHRSGPRFGRPSRSENTSAGYRAEGWCDGGDESIRGDPEQPFRNTGAEAEAPADGAA